MNYQRDKDGNVRQDSHGHDVVNLSVGTSFTLIGMTASVLVSIVMGGIWMGGSIRELQSATKTIESQNAKLDNHGDRLTKIETTLEVIKDEVKQHRPQVSQ